MKSGKTLSAYFTMVLGRVKRTQLSRDGNKFIGFQLTKTKGGSRVLHPMVNFLPFACKNDANPRGFKCPGSHVQCKAIYYRLRDSARKTFYYSLAIRLENTTKLKVFKCVPRDLQYRLLHEISQRFTSKRRLNTKRLTGHLSERFREKV